MTILLSASSQLEVLKKRKVWLTGLRPEVEAICVEVRPDAAYVTCGRSVLGSGSTPDKAVDAAIATIARFGECTPHVDYKVAPHLTWWAKNIK